MHLLYHLRYHHLPIQRPARLSALGADAEKPRGDASKFGKLEKCGKIGFRSHPQGCAVCSTITVFGAKDSK